MNKTEEEYANLLELRKRAGEIVWYAFEPVTIHLAKRTSYRPDFMVMLATGELQAHEVKGYWLDDARAKIKVAAEKMPLRFVAVKKRSKKAGGGFEEEWF